MDHSGSFQAVHSGKPKWHPVHACHVRDTSSGDTSSKRKIVLVRVYGTTANIDQVMETAFYYSTGDAAM